MFENKLHLFFKSVYMCASSIETDCLSFSESMLLLFSIACVWQSTGNNYDFLFVDWLLMVLFYSIDFNYFGLVKVATLIGLFHPINLV